MASVKIPPAVALLPLGDSESPRDVVSGTHRVALNRVSPSSGILAQFGVGSRINGRYLLNRFISEGATSGVFAAHDELANREVAVKIVRFGLDRSERSIDRLQLEVLVYRLASSPHLPRLLDAGRLANGAPFIVMELVSGLTLADRLASGPLPIPAVIDLGRQLMAGLHAAHRHGIAHRDIKPRNLILEERADGTITVKIIDFGICTRQHSARSKQPTVLGTPSYMSPEQISGETSDVRTDVYSGSVVLYEALTGRLPFEGTSAAQIMTAALHAPLLPPRLLRESCPAELEDVLLRGLSRDAAHRWASAELVAAELELIVAQHGFPTGAEAWRQRSSIPPRQATASSEATQRAPSIPR